jgi:outer membrane putative beta-barrel porin/alpha-amylase
MMSTVKQTPDSLPSLRRTRARALAAAAFVAGTACAGEPVSAQEERTQRADKSHYHLFNPTPRRLLRELSTDRPDVTESPYTVDAGHFQAEISFVEYARDDEGGVELEQLAVLPMNLKVGLLHNVDLQFVFTPYIHQEADANAFSQSDSGFGETQLRLKVNLWGNDGDGPFATLPDTALAVMPFVQLPTGEDDLGFADEVEGGVIVPFATSLPREFTLGLMVEFDFVRDDADDGYDLEFLHTASVGHDLVGDLAGFVEYVGVASTGDRYQSSLGAGLTYGLGPDAQLDGGLLVGLNENAQDLLLFAGLSFRL